MATSESPTLPCYPTCPPLTVDSAKITPPLTVDHFSTCHQLTTLRNTHNVPHNRPSEPSQTTLKQYLTILDSFSFLSSIQLLTSFSFAFEERKSNLLIMYAQCVIDENVINTCKKNPSFSDRVFVKACVCECTKLVHVKKGK